MSSKQQDGHMLGAIAGDIIGSVYEHRNIKKTQFPLFHPL
jgi:ADP-ribosylglycohydrolase